MQWSELVALDDLDPIQRYEVMANKSGAVEFMDLIMKHLFVVDKKLSSYGFKSPIYILDDSSIFKLINNKDKVISEGEFKKVIFLIHQSQLVYRFTTARKFRIADTSTKQLRINSWGRLYCETLALKTCSQDLHKIQLEIDQLFEEADQIYQKVVKAFHDIDQVDGSSELVKSYNTQLLIKVVC
ncbi:hypothetical protein CC202_07610 [Pseudomonas savastanoi]|uniref:hypothetical protein n=1 Tax=Pseudomonas savastanoi TaxID=29438 RepID=UPI000BA4D913|nr:hypothetical protein [Pseudomonas savastanoi]PAB34391.1 hypothetical protein CC202_07610 [Pseudomonas savastanoi]